MVETQKSLEINKVQQSPRVTSSPVFQLNRNYSE